MNSWEKILEKMDPGIRAYYDDCWPTGETSSRNAGRKEMRNRDRKNRPANAAPPRTAEILYREWRKNRDKKNTSRASQ
jgi:hypothetical protein